VEALGEEERGRQRVFVESQFGRRVFEGSVLCAVVAVPAAGREAVGIIADEA
jgi:hypothetical protein